MIGFVILTLLGLGFALGGFSDTDENSTKPDPEEPGGDRTTFDVDDGEMVTGTDANETFNLIGAGTAFGGGGGDIFDLAAPGAEAHGQAGGDRFQINAAGTTSHGEEGDDRFINKSGLPEDLTTVAYGGPGNDAFSFGGSAVGYGGEGNDSFSLSGNATGVGGPGDDDFSNVVQDTIGQGGAGNDNFTIIGGNGQAEGGTGDDVFNSVGGNATVLGQAGNDVIGIETNGSATINGGDDGDLLLYFTPSQFYDDTTQGSTATGGEGADLFMTWAFDQIEDNDVVAPNVITDFDPDKDILGVILPPSGNTQLDSVDVTPAANGSYTDVRLNFVDDTQNDPIETSQFFRLIGQSDFDPSLIKVVLHQGNNVYDYTYEEALAGAQDWVMPPPS